MELGWGRGRGEEGRGGRGEEGRREGRGGRDWGEGKEGREGERREGGIGGGGVSMIKCKHTATNCAHLFHSLTPATMTILQHLNDIHLQIHQHTIANFKHIPCLLHTKYGQVLLIETTSFGIRHCLQVRLQWVWSSSGEV